MLPLLITIFTVEHGIKTVYAIDRDIEAVNIARQLSHELCEQNQSINLVPIHGPFSQMTALLKQNGVRLALIIS